MNHITNSPTSEAQEALEYFSKELPTWKQIMKALNDQDPEAVRHYSALMDSLKAEQRMLCCYCERELPTAQGQCHVEHVRPQSKYSNEIFEYTNIACSCNGRTGSDKHCGHLKGGDFDEALFVAPHDPAIDGLFLYDVEGGIGAASSANDPSAEHMIRELGLRCARLASMRRGHGKGLVSTIDSFLEHEDAVEYIKAFSVEYIEPRTDGSLHQFFSLSRQLFAAKIGANVAGGLV